MTPKDDPSKLATHTEDIKSISVVKTLTSNRPFSTETAYSENTNLRIYIFFAYSHIEAWGNRDRGALEVLADVPEYQIQM